ncbi:MAG: hypothetical protein IJM15_08730 [Erysipelotrichaceae bacterium]|nr:hypothetical protein [Erysipelotrichaceae bacterium]
MLKYKIVHDEPDVKGIIYMFEEETLHYDSCFTYVSLEVDDWNRELSPWPFSAGKMVFSGEGPETLKELLKIIKEVEKERSFEKRYIGGYSLGALFALYCCCESDMFDGVASCSASMWFEGFKDYFIKSEFIRTKLFYLSLGKKEELTRNIVMSAVGNNTRDIYEYLKIKGYQTVLVMNEGGHFNETNERFQKGLDWLIENGKA